MYCMNCGEKLPDNASFCSRCGEMCLKPVSGRPASNPNRNAVASSARHNISGKRSPQRQNASSWGSGSLLAGTALGLFFSRLFGSSPVASASHPSPMDSSSHVHETFIHDYDDDSYDLHGYGNRENVEWEENERDDGFDDYNDGYDDHDDYDDGYGDDYDDYYDDDDD